jgi:hypothetical protein
LRRSHQENKELLAEHGKLEKLKNKHHALMVEADPEMISKRYVEMK